MNSGKRRVVLRHTYVIHGFVSARTLETVEVGINRRAGNFARPIGTEIVENDAVVRFNAVVISDYDRLDKLVVNLIRVRLLDAARGSVEFFAHAREHAVVTFFNALPAVVAIHIIISAHYRGYARGRIEFRDLVLHLADVFYRAVRGTSRPSVTQ